MGATLRVDNQSSYEVVIYAVRGGSERVRLGNANAVGVTTLRIPSDFARGSAVSFVVDPIGVVRAPVTEQITIWPGEEVEIRVPPM